MPQSLKSSPYAILLVAMLACASCQNEEPFMADIDPELTLAAGSTVVEMIKRISSNDGSYDNIVDGASCLDIQFPYTVTIKGTELSISAMEDLQKIEDLFDADDDGPHLTEIAYPITIVIVDYTEIIVNSDEVLRDYIQECVEGGEDDDIECIDVVYPVNLFTYDPNLQQTGSVTVDHDKELRRFLAGLTGSDLISIEFPLVFQRFDSTEVSVANNSELSATLERAAEMCDEDDDNDYNDDDFTQDSLNSFLIACPWSVRKLERTGLNEPEQYQNYRLIFTKDGQVISENGELISEDGQVISEDVVEPINQGSWSVTVSDFKVFLTMEFEDAEAFSGTMYTYRIGEGTIKMDGGESDKIILEQQCSSGPES